MVKINKLLLMALLLVITLYIPGCAKAKVEKMPVVIENRTNQSLDYVLSQSDTQTGLAQLYKNKDSQKLILQYKGKTEEISGKEFKSDMGYQMTYDSDNFVVSCKNGIDSFIAQNSNPELFPYIFINIYRYVKPIADESSKENQCQPGYTLKIQDESITSYISVDSFTYCDATTVGIYVAKHYRESLNSLKINLDIYNDDNQSTSDLPSDDSKHSSSKSLNLYIIEEDKNYNYLILTNSNEEVEDDYSVRIKAMLDSFTIYNSKSN